MTSGRSLTDTEKRALLLAFNAQYRFKAAIATGREVRVEPFNRLVKKGLVVSVTGFDAVNTNGFPVTGRKAFGLTTEGDRIAKELTLGEKVI